MAFAAKKQIANSLRGIGITTLDASAVSILADFVQGDSDKLNEFMRQWQSDGLHGDRLSVDAVESVISQMRGVGSGGGTRQGLELCSVINAFTVPKISYDPVGRKLYADNEPRSIFAPANSKSKLYLDRLHLIAQRIRRSTLFQAQTFNGGSSNSPQLTDIQSLKGATLGSKRFVLGCISKSEDGRYVLEDQSGSVPLDISKAMTASGFYTENCIVIAEGEMNVDGAFHALAMGLPPTELRENLPMAAQRLNFFGGPEMNSEDRGNLILQEMDRDHDRLVVLSDVFLDRKEVLDSLHVLFSGYNEMNQTPPLFILMGNFHSKASTSGANGGSSVDFAAMKDNFNSLAAVIEQYPKMRRESRFVLVPGPQDPGPSNSLPQPPLAAYFTGELTRVLGENVTFSSNPCRIRYLSQEIVVFRYDILKRMRRRCLIPPANVEDWLASGSLLPGIIPPLPPQASARAALPGELTQQEQASATHSVMWEHLALTLLQQSHLCPLPLLLQPIYWQYDHAMSLYPLPHAVVVADSSPQAQTMHQGCVVFNPGSFADGGLFAAYKPCGGQQVELNEVPRDGILPSYEGEEEEEEEGEEEGEAVNVVEEGEAMVEEEGEIEAGPEADHVEGDDDDGAEPMRDREDGEEEEDKGMGEEEDDVEAFMDQEKEEEGGSQGGAKRMRVAEDEREVAWKDAMDEEIEA